MLEDEEGGSGKGLRSKKKDIDIEVMSHEEEASQTKQGEPVSLASIREIMKDTMSKAMSEVENNISQQLLTFQDRFQTDIKQQLGEIRAEFNQKTDKTMRKLEAT